MTRVNVLQFIELSEGSVKFFLVAAFLTGQALSCNTQDCQLCTLFAYQLLKVKEKALPYLLLLTLQ